MQNTRDALSLAAQAMEGVENKAREWVREFRSRASSCPEGATSSTPPTTAPGGDGSAPSTTGPMVADAVAVLMAGAAAVDRTATIHDAKAVANDYMNRALSCLDFADCASGGPVSQPRRSDEPPANSPGGCCARPCATAPSPPTETRTPIDLNEALRTVEGQVFCSWDQSDEYRVRMMRSAGWLAAHLLDAYPDRFTM